MQSPQLQQENTPLNSPSSFPSPFAAARMAFEGNATAAVLIGQRVIGAKSFGR